MTGRAPGRPRQTGHVCVLGGASAYAFEQPQNIFEAVLSWQWTSIPITASYRSEASPVECAWAAWVIAPVRASAKFGTGALREAAVHDPEDAAGRCGAGHARRSIIRQPRRPNQ